MIQLGVISDIHGDYKALCEALDLLNQFDLDGLVCAGDLVTRGEDGDKVVEHFRENMIPCVAGNHDKRNADTADLTEESLQYLESLPLSIQMMWENRRIYVTHGTPWSNWSRVYPVTDRNVFRRVATEAQANVVILGHTHVPMIAHVRNILICNPGSVCGTHTPGRRTCGVLTLPDCTFDVYNIDDGTPFDVPYKPFFT